jgi:soluble lytic murein transglycosylase
MLVRMKFRALIVCGLAAAAILLAWFAVGKSYRVQELVFGNRFASHDARIAAAAARYGVSPSLVKAVIWRESRFQPDMLGAHGERGLMQITEGAARDWARAEKIATFVPTDLLDPKTNIDAGTWYLANALRHWAGKDDPIPFALAEYNAGRTRVKRWERDSGLGGDFGAEELRAAMDFPATKAYIRAIIERYRDYERTGEFPQPPPAP